MNGSIIDTMNKKTNENRVHNKTKHTIRLKSGITKHKSETMRRKSNSTKIEIEIIKAEVETIRTEFDNYKTSMIK